MSVAVVIPLFNGAPWIRETLESVLWQECRPDEIVVVDDGSVDDGPERAADFDRVRVIPSSRKLRARHTGLLATRGEYVAFLDQDDVWHPSHLQGLIDTLSAAHDVPAAAAATRRFRDRDPPRFSAHLEGHSPLHPWSIWPLSCPIHTPSAVLFRRDLLEASGGWRVDSAPDWEVYLRLTDARPILLRHAGTCAYRIHVAARSAELRREGGQYLGVLQRGADASLAERRARGADEEWTARLKRRRGLLEHVQSLIRGLAEGDRAACVSSARALERDTETESLEYVAGVFDLLTYVLCPDEDAAEHKRLCTGLLLTLDAVWPKDAERTRTPLVARTRHLRFRWRRVVRAVLKGRLDEALALLRRRRERASLNVPGSPIGRRADVPAPRPPRHPTERPG